MKTKADQLWTEREIALLKELYPQTPVITDLMVHFPGRTRNSLSGKARTLELKRGPYGQQEPFDIPQTAAAYLAGLIDCDGSISIRASHRRGNLNLRPAIVVFNTDTRLHDWIIRTLKSSNQISRCRKRQGNQKPIYEWKVQSVVDVARLIRTILPYFVLKSEQAHLLLEWCENRTPYTDYTERELEIRKMVLSLNERGQE